MLKFAVLNLKTKKTKVVLTFISILMCSIIALTFFNVAEQVNAGVISTAGFYDTIIGPEGSSLDLTLSTLFYSNNPLGTIPYEYYERYAGDPEVKEIHPIATGDTYRSCRIIGTTREFLSKNKITEGRLFDKSQEAVLGYQVANKSGFKIGDTFLGTHGNMEGGHIHEDYSYTVVGILKKTNTASDNAIFTSIDSVWAVHHHGGEEESHEILSNGDESHEHDEESYGLDEGQHDHDRHSHEHGDLTAIVLKTSSLSAQARIVKELSDEHGVQAVNPASELRKLLSNVSIGKDLILAMSVVIILMAVIIIYVSTLSAIQDGKKDIVTMRLIGIKRRTIELILMLQTVIISTCALISAFGGQMLLILIMNNFSSRNFGIILDPTKHYAGEGFLVAIIFALNLAATSISLIPLYRRDPLEV